MKGELDERRSKNSPPFQSQWLQCHRTPAPSILMLRHVSFWRPGLRAQSTAGKSSSADLARGRPDDAVLLENLVYADMFVRHEGPLSLRLFVAEANRRNELAANDPTWRAKGGPPVAFFRQRRRRSPLRVWVWVSRRLCAGALEIWRWLAGRLLAVPQATRRSRIQPKPPCAGQAGGGEETCPPSRAARCNCR